MMASSHSTTKCTTCNETFVSGTAISMHNVGEFCSVQCFLQDMEETRENENHVTFPTDEMIEFESFDSYSSQPAFQAPTRPSSQPAFQAPTRPISQPAFQAPTRPSSQPAFQAPTRPSSQPAFQAPTRASSQPVIQASPQVPPQAPTRPSSQPTYVPPPPPAQTTYVLPSAPALTPNRLVPIFPTNDPNPPRVNNVIVQRFPTDLLPPPSVNISIAPPPPQPKPKPRDISPVMGVCTFCERTETLTCENPKGQRFCNMGLLVRYGDGYGHAMAKLNPTTIPGLGTFDSWARYAVPFVYSK